jgi:hypothetical protein
MGVRSKSVIVLIVTLLLGVLIGTLLVGPLIARRHFDRVDAMRTREGFAQRMERIIEPDASQTVKVRQILTKHAAQFDGIFTQHRLQMDALVDSMWQELGPILTDEQRARLEHSKPGHGRPPRHGNMPPGGVPLEGMRPDQMPPGGMPPDEPPEGMPHGEPAAGMPLGQPPDSTAPGQPPAGAGSR